MAQIHCRKCDKDSDSITDNLFMGKLEAEVKEKVCQTCWNEWADFLIVGAYAVAAHGQPWAE